MSFNTSNISCDTLTGTSSISAPVHYVDGFPISNVSGVLTIGDSDNSSMSCLSVTANTQIIAPIGEIDTLSTNTIIPTGGVGGIINVSGSLVQTGTAEVSNLKIHGTLSGDNGDVGSLGQLLSSTGSNIEWINAPTASNWSSFEALQNVDINNYQLNNVLQIDVLSNLNLNGSTTITAGSGGVGTAGQVLSSTGSSTQWIDVSLGSNWSTYPAEQAVDMQSYGFSNCGDISSGGNINITAGEVDINCPAVVNALKVSGAFKDSTDSTGSSGQVLTSNGTSTQWQDIPNWSTVQASQDIDCGSHNLANVDNFSANTVSVSGVLFDGTHNTGSVGQVLRSLGTSTLWADVTPADWSSYPATQDVQFDGYNINNVNTMTVQTLTGYAGSIATTTPMSVGGVLSSTSLKPSYNHLNTLYVSPNGDDSSGNGTFEAPYATLNRANADINSDAGANVYLVNIGMGNYAEDLVIEYPSVWQGVTQSELANYYCSITGQVDVSLSSTTDLNSSDVVIDGLLINGPVNNVSSTPNRLIITNSYLYLPSSNYNPLLQNVPSTTNSRLFLRDVKMSSDNVSATNPLITVTSGMVSFVRVSATSKSNQNVLQMSANASCDSITFCQFENDYNNAVIPALVEIQNGASYTFSNCGFIYSSAVSKSQPYSCGIYANSSSTSPTIFSFYNVFELLGCSTGLYAINDANYGASNKMTCFYYMSSALPNTAFAIHAVLNVNKFQFQTVS